VCPTLSALSRRQHCIPDGRRTSTLETPPAEIELFLVDPMQQFDPGNCDRGGLKPLKSQHWTDAQLYTAVVLLDQVIEIL
jgi:hypothetical protein